jgi:beta-phosphoglucomutase-like phosphatase (HAD superfamily)
MPHREIHAWLTDMDGVLVHEDRAIPGAAEFIERLRERDLPFLVLTNNSIYTRRDLSARFRASGLEVPERCGGTAPRRLQRARQALVPQHSLNACPPSGAA